MMNWVILIDMYTLMCIKLMTNKNLYKKKISSAQLRKPCSPSYQGPTKFHYSSTDNYRDKNIKRRICQKNLRSPFGAQPWTCLLLYSLSVVAEQVIL